MSHQCQVASHQLEDGPVPEATNRVRFFCTRCTRGSTPETQTDLNLCDGCQVVMANMTMDCAVSLSGCGYIGRGVDFIHPDGPPTSRPPVFNGKEQ